ncbi:MAG: sulfotransferase [gamma proteobacterium symbiont of Bathyaustriella thionipta]|nr:sulfotransferase [gamma proteobacterium symbiont of Bathyaustriella thionipta]MCU7949292.1 sulfotransferase [gamma proteobacterium symbiont of Bathyaustriella thionipta]MCU7953994.1 sulfotransferase [gamma proteobacterium symbiont of Bathyaustriella thionipta]MCU7955895.1 sulfotransferase [gamma proteobacterium symbiont of Bathyaustriella thionipta]MCU7966383.1 sulfotransferase [gamma proteobacterium symbiont of Bathyaustriella thionipta]
MSMFFLMCSERSGSNFITKLMNGHSNIVGPSIKHIVNPVARNIFRYGDLKNKKNWIELIEDIYRLVSVDFSVWKSDLSKENLLNLAPVGDVQAFIRNIFMEEGKAHGKQHVFIKENQNYEYLPFLMSLFPENKYIYLVRDPRDMALSWKKNDNIKGGVVHAAKQWKKDQQNFLKNYWVLRQNNNAHFVTYENLIEFPEKEIKNILNFLGLSYEDNMLHFYKDPLTKENSSMNSAWNNLSQGVMKNNKKKYLNDLDDYEVKIIEKICCHEMNYLDYKLENSIDELDKLTVADIENFNNVELNRLAYSPVNGIKANMDAKKVFYEKVIY